jgi:apolipoprotein N-acyltransferase
VRARWAALIAVGAGLLGVLAFPPFGVWPLAALSVASFSVAVHGRRARTGAWLGLVYGLTLFAPLLHWSGVYVGPIPWLVLSLAVAAFVAGVGALLAVVQRLPAAPLWIGAVWVLEEYARDRFPFGGFPWGRWAFSQAQSPLRWFAALGGAPLVTFVTAAAGGGLAMALLGVNRRAVRPAVTGLAVLALVPVLGLLTGLAVRPAPDSAGRTVAVALIQGSVPDRGLEFNARRRQVLDNHVQQTMTLAAEIKAGTVAKPDIVLWPENSSDIDPYDNTDAFREISEAADAVETPILVGAILDGPGPNHVSNVGILWNPYTGPAATYTKRHPVPFGEYIPLRSVARFFSDKVDLVRQDMAAGTGTGLITGGPFPIGDVICFEVAYDGLVESSVRDGAQALVIQTNNATFGHTAETYQQLAMSELRAVEHGRSVLQVATSGKSAVIGPDGTVRQESGPLFTPAILNARVPLRSGLTLATRLGAVPEEVLAALALVGVVLAVWRTRRRDEAPDHRPRTEELIAA